MFNFLRKFFSQGYDSILGDFRKAMTKLEALAVREEKNAEALLEQHVSIKALEVDARNLAAKARTTAANIGKLIA